MIFLKKICCHKNSYEKPPILLYAAYFFKGYELIDDCINGNAGRRMDLQLAGYVAAVGSDGVDGKA
jgi:hypothetical protein